MVKDTVKKEKEKSFVDKLKSAPNFIKGLNKLGFPLEFKIRHLLKEKDYKNVQEGFFTYKEENQDIVKTFDILAYKSKQKKIWNDLTINLDLQLVGDCKYSSDPEKFLFAIPDTSNPENKLFIGPLLTNFQAAVYSSYRNSELVSRFIERFGKTHISSDIKDTSQKHITSKNGNKEDKDTPEYERIFKIVENTILPATKEKFVRWRESTYRDYQNRIGEEGKKMTKQQLIESQKRGFYGARLIIPFIVTSKPIIIPITNKKYEITDIKEIPFTLYEHSALKPNDYKEILGVHYDIGVFICNEKHFEKFLKYVENIHDKTFKEITTNLSNHPQRLIEDFEGIQKYYTELKGIDPAFT